MVDTGNANHVRDDNHFIGLRVNSTLYETIAREALDLGISVAAVARIRLRTGRPPTVLEPARAE